MSGDITLQGFVQLGNTLDRIPLVVRDRLLKRAVRAGAEPIAETARAALPVRTGAARSAMDVRVTSRGAKGETVRAYIGLRRNVKVPVRVIQFGKNKGKLLVAIPTRYGHLIERGHRIVDKYGKTIGMVKPIPFMAIAWGVSGGDVALDKVTNSLQEGIANTTF